MVQLLGLKNCLVIYTCNWFFIKPRDGCKVFFVLVKKPTSPHIPPILNFPRNLSGRKASRETRPTQLHSILCSRSCDGDSKAITIHPLSSSSSSAWSLHLLDRSPHSTAHCTSNAPPDPSPRLHRRWLPPPSPSPPHRRLPPWPRAPRHGTLVLLIFCVWFPWFGFGFFFN